MKNRVYRLIEPKVIKVFEEPVDVGEDQVLVRPTHMSICHADQRYYQGQRSADVLKKKLPMALIHESIGRVVEDKEGRFREGDLVAMVPNTPYEKDEIIHENYLRSSHFRASGYDGFMQDVVSVRRDRVMPLDGVEDPDIFAFLEICSVAWHIIDRFDQFADARRSRLGVWGEGNMGFILSLFLKYRFPDAKIIVFGVVNEKLHEFTFADETYNVGEIPGDVYVDHAFECVGSAASGIAVNQIINDVIRPQGTIALTGVSEESVPIHTRMVLEKGLCLFGSSRSGREDFENAAAFIQAHPDVQEELKKVVGKVVHVATIEDIHEAFSEDLGNPGRKTVLRWDMDK